MHIGILFYSDTVLLSQNDPRVMMGRFIANNEFMTALLNDPKGMEVTLFVSSAAERGYLQDYFKKRGVARVPRVVPLLEMKMFLRENRVAVIHLMDPNMYRGFYVREQLAGYPLAVTGVTHSLGSSPFLDWMALDILGGPLPCDALICTSPTAKQVIENMLAVFVGRFKEQFLLNCEVIPLGIQLDWLMGSQTNVRSELGISDDTVVVLCFSRFSHRIKADMLPVVSLFSKVMRQTTKKVKFIMAGAEGKENNIEVLTQVVHGLQIDASIVFVKNPDDALKKKLFRTADLFLAWSDNVQETFGLTVIEALSAGLPVIASDWDGYRSLVSHGETGYLVPTVMLGQCPLVDGPAPLQVDSLNHMFLSQSVAIDQDEALRYLLLLIEDDQQRQRLSQNALGAARRFAWPEVIDQYKALWSRLADKSQDYFSGQKKIPLLNYHDVFRHYATRVLAATDRIHMTEAGKQALMGKVEIRKYLGMEEILSSQLLALILKETQQPQRLSSLITKATRFSFSEDLVSYHVLWLYKYGYVAVSP